MSSSVYCPSNKHVDLPCIRRIGIDQPAAWLDAGWNDFRRAWLTSLPYGLVLGGMGLALLYYAADRPYLAVALASGFLLVAPVIALGLYQISRRLEWQDNGMVGERPPVGRLFDSNIALFGVLLAVIFAIWVDLAAITTALLTPRELAITGSFSLLALFSLDNLPFVLGYFGVGGLLAALVFSLSVITLPMLLERQVDLVTAVSTSLVVVKENPAAMAVWAAIIAAVMLAGMLSLFIGFAILFPVLGHATWHAYRDVVERS